MGKKDIDIIALEKKAIDPGRIEEIRLFQHYSIAKVAALLGISRSSAYKLTLKRCGGVRLRYKIIAGKKVVSATELGIFIREYSSK